jgi:hypothetical protein
MTTGPAITPIPLLPCLLRGPCIMCDHRGTCPDPDRDACPLCERCTEWEGEFCRECGYEWGSGDA